jgi:hypothetical protein
MANADEGGTSHSIALDNLKHASSSLAKQSAQLGKQLQYSLPS